MELSNIPDEWFRKLVDCAPDVLILIDSEGSIVLANARTLQIFGYESQELIGKSVDILVPAQFRSAHAVHRDGYFAEPKAREMGADLALTGVRKDGVEFPVEISLSPLRTDQGVYTVAAVRDATSRRRSQQQMARLLEAAPDAMVIINARGLIELVNAQTEILFGFDRRALQGRPVELLIPETLRERHTEHRKTFFKSPKIREMGAGQELSGRRKNGTEFPIAISLSPLETDSGVLVTAAIRDISDRKRAERQLKEYADRLEISNRELEDFAHVAAHDLKAPLNNIRQFALILKEELGEQMTEENNKQYEFLDSSVRHMRNLIDDLLQLGRIGQAQSLIEKVSLTQVVESACQQLRSEITKVNGNILMDKLPEIYADASMMVQVFQNLIGNALKFQQPEVQPEVRITADTNINETLIRVTDNGIGVEKADQTKVFDVFTRMHGASTFEGSGVGLSICRKIVERHGGKIGMAAAHGGGCEVWISLPNEPT